MCSFVWLLPRLSGFNLVERGVFGYVFSTVTAARRGMWRDLVPRNLADGSGFLGHWLCSGRHNSCVSCLPAPDPTGWSRPTVLTGRPWTVTGRGRPCLVPRLKGAVGGFVPLRVM